MVGGGDSFYLKFWVKLTPFERNRRFSVDIRPVLIKYILLGVTAEVLRAKIDWQDAQLSQRDRAAGCVIVFAKVEDYNWDTIFYGHYNRSIFNHCDIIGLKICRIRWKTQKRLLRRSTSFKVIDVGNRKPVCDFLLVINSNWHHISYPFGVIAAYCSNFAPTRPLWLKILGRRGRPPPIIFCTDS